MLEDADPLSSRGLLLPRQGTTLVVPTALLNERGLYRLRKNSFRREAGVSTAA
jgi:hypothetical protein